MDCVKIGTLLHPYLDGELDLVASLEVENHLQSCAACAVSRENIRTLRTGLRDESLYFSGPATLPASVLASIGRETTPIRRSFVLTSWRVWAAAAAFVIAALLGWNFVRPRPLPVTTDLLAQEVVSSHIRSLMGAHLADVASTSRHTVKPWFNGRLDYSPPVKDLAAQGFPLIGGRLDYLDNRPVAALVYRRQKHLINLFVWPAVPANEASKIDPDAVTRQGYHVRHWDKAGMTYWSVSDVNSAELSRFVQLIQANDAPVTDPLP